MTVSFLKTTLDVFDNSAALDGALVSKCVVKMMKKLANISKTSSYCQDEVCFSVSYGAADNLTNHSALLRLDQSQTPMRWARRCTGS